LIESVGSRQPFLSGNKLFLRVINEKDLEGRYFDWLNDCEVTKYLETGFFPNSSENMLKYFNDVGRNVNNVLLAIIDAKTNKHIGNIRLGPINWIHRNAFLGIIVGEKEFWGKGYATESIKLMVEYGFDRLNLHKISAGVNNYNTASLKAFERVGFEEEGRRKEELFVDGRYCDSIILGLTFERFKKLFSK
jgi:ribosomal-protein-alanine N-acetyltransferase